MKTRRTRSRSALTSMARWPPSRPPTRIELPELKSAAHAGFSPRPANHLSLRAMSEAALAMTRPGRKPRPQHVSKAQSRSQILDAARRVAARDGARDLSLRSVAAEAGFAPAGLYGYFRSKDELLLALAADDLTQLARAMREAGGLKDAATTALALLGGTETMAAASQALPREGGGGDA